jgi:Ser/Thr protein kinase RdoA (MazF antagonist)
VDDLEAGYGARAEPTPVLLAAVWAAYGLDGEAASEGSDGPGAHGIRDLGGGFTLNLLAKRHGRHVVVRVYRPWVSVARLADLQRIRELLREASIPTPAVVPTVDGEPWCRLHGRLVEVDEYVENDANMDTWPRLSAAMSTLGRIHSALCGIDATPETRCPVYANAVDAADALATTRLGIARIRSWDDKAGRSMLRMCDEAEEIAEIVAAAEAPSPPTYRQLVHGDFWDSNVLFRSGRLVAVIDFDFLGYRPRVDDLALTLFFADLTRAPPDAERIPRLRGLVDRYNSGLRHPLTAAERADIPAALARQQLWSFGHVAKHDEQSARHLAGVLGSEVRRTLPIARDLETWRAAFT